jgi:hypothetical protein
VNALLHAVFIELDAAHEAFVLENAVRCRDAVRFDQLKLRLEEIAGALHHATNREQIAATQRRAKREPLHRPEVEPIGEVERRRRRDAVEDALGVRFPRVSASSSVRPRKSRSMRECGTMPVPTVDVTFVLMTPVASGALRSRSALALPERIEIRQRVAVRPTERRRPLTQRGPIVTRAVVATAAEQSCFVNDRPSIVYDAFGVPLDLRDQALNRLELRLVRLCRHLHAEPGSETKSAPARLMDLVAAGAHALVSDSNCVLRRSILHQRTDFAQAKGFPSVR